MPTLATATFLLASLQKLPTRCHGRPRRRKSRFHLCRRASLNAPRLSRGMRATAHVPEHPRGSLYRHGSFLTMRVSCSAIQRFVFELLGFDLDLELSLSHGRSVVVLSWPRVFVPSEASYVVVSGRPVVGSTRCGMCDKFTSTQGFFHPDARAGSSVRSSTWCSLGRLYSRFSHVMFGVASEYSKTPLNSQDDIHGGR